MSEEAVKAEAATAELQRLLNHGPFEMVGRIDDMKDRYGRDLRALRRCGRMEPSSRSPRTCDRAATRGGISAGLGGVVLIR